VKSWTEFSYLRLSSGGELLWTLEVLNATQSGRCYLTVRANTSFSIRILLYGISFLFRSLESGHSPLRSNDRNNARNFTRSTVVLPTFAAQEVGWGNCSSPPTLALVCSMFASFCTCWSLQLERSKNAPAVKLQLLGWQQVMINFRRYIPGALIN
jgi:hypothetical protein